MNRRDLLKTGSFAGAAILLPASGVFAAPPALAAHQHVISALAHYSGRVLPKVSGSDVYLLASIDRIPAFLDVARRGKALPYPNMRAAGNVLSFTQGGTHYRIENVLPAHFNARAKALG